MICIRVLVTGAGGGSGLATIKILKESTGHVVFGADANPNSSGLYLADKKFIVPKAADSGFLERIVSLVKDEDVDIIIPNVDEELQIFAKNLENIPCNVIISKPEAVVLCRDKLKLISHMNGVVDTPFLNPDYPILVKPRIGRGSRNVFVIKDEKEFYNVINHLESLGFKKDEFLFQEYLPGKEYTVDVMCDSSGKPVVIVPRERVRVLGGVSVIGRTIKNNIIIKLVGDICKKIEFFGPINIQFKENASGRVKLTEINPRCSGGMPITYKSGVNIPRLAIKLVFGEKILPEELEWEEKTVFRYLTEV